MRRSFWVITSGKRGLGLSAPVVTAALLVPLICACGSSNPGGSMQCGAYRALGTSDRLTAVKAMIDQRGGNDSPDIVDGTELSVDAYCFTHSSDETINGVFNK